MSKLEKLSEKLEKSNDENIKLKVMAKVLAMSNKELESFLNNVKYVQEYRMIALFNTYLNEYNHINTSVIKYDYSDVLKIMDKEEYLRLYENFIDDSEDYIKIGNLFYDLKELLIKLQTKETEIK